ncbi:MAG: UDP-glucose 4-epimerase GalE [Clostridia bacterium]|nr:UDP-glucose 4-epimerase GalE [Clostridia bacterium]
MKVLVTGGAGYIGSHTSLELLNGGHDVVILDNLSNSSAEAVSRIETLSGKKTAFYQADVRDKETLRKIFQAHKIDWVIHFAGLKAVGESCAKPIEYYDNNLYGTLCLLEVMKEAGVKKLIFSSSATVYGTPETLPLTENSKTGGTTNPYGTSKYFQEIMLEDVYKSDPTWTVVLLRYFNPVGAHESGMIGEDPKGIPNNLTPFIAKVAIGELPEIGVFGNDYPTKDGTGVRDYIHVVDLAKGHVAAMDNVKKSGVYVYNLGTGNGYSVLEVIAAFEKACGKKLPYSFKPRRAGDIAECYADASKAKRELGWEAKLGIDEMCASLWNWQSKNPNGYKK